MPINIWNNQGTVLGTINGQHAEQPNVLFEGGAVILSGTVFKMWTGTATGVCYAESPDGLTWTAYSSNPVISSAAHTFPRVFKNNGTYYLYTCPATTGNLAAYTSPDGVTWTLANANALVRGSQAWETGSSNFFGQLSIVGVIGGVWYGYYTSYITATKSYAMGLATSSDGITWTKSPSNPVITTFGPSNFWFQQIGGVYYGWSQIVIPNIPPFSSGLGLPSDIMRFSATNPAGPWTPLGTSTFYRTLASEGIGMLQGQVADPSLVSANGSIYLYQTAKSAGASSNNGVINCSIATSMTFAQLVQTYEGIFDIPIPEFQGPFDLTLGLNVSDNFQRGNANPAGGNWSTGTGKQAIQIVSNAIESVGGGNSLAYYNAQPFSADQWAQVTVGAGVHGSNLGVALRVNTSGVNTSYVCYWNANSSGLGVSGIPTIAKYVNGTFTSLATDTEVSAATTVQVGSVLTGAVVGSTLSFYINGFLVVQVSDTSILTGAPGIFMTEGATPSDTIITAFAGGNMLNPPPINSGGGNSSWLAVDLNNSLRGLRH